MKLFRLQITDAATEDLVEIVDDLSSHASPEIARRVVADIAAGFDALTMFPNRFEAARDGGPPHRRQMMIHSYRILFRVSRTTVTVVAVVHAAKRRA
jgi:plasmid stabilization system protein ParE